MQILTLAAVPIRTKSQEARRTLHRRVHLPLHPPKHCQTQHRIQILCLLVDQAVNSLRLYKAGNHHILNQKSLAKHMLHQLAQDPDYGCVCSERKALSFFCYNLSLESYTYSHAAKETVTVFKASLEHEGVQGELYGSNLGISLSSILTFSISGYTINHMLLISCASG